jgi:hypothetical protein
MVLQLRRPGRDEKPPSLAPSLSALRRSSAVDQASRATTAGAVVCVSAVDRRIDSGGGDCLRLTTPACDLARAHDIGSAA